MEWYMILALIGIGLVTGFMNTLAGGGSALSLPMLMFLGLPANVANGTNRIAILLQSIVGVNTFYKRKVLDYKTDYKLTVPAVAGSLLGALFAVEIDETILRKVIAALMIVMLLMVIFKPEVWVKEHAGKVEAKPTILQYIIFFFIGFYGGFIQMGVGFFLLAGLVLGGGYNLVRANAVKIFIVLVFTVFSIGIFIFHKQVDLLSGFVLAVGSMAGAWLGAHFSVKGGAKLVRYVLIIAMIGVILNLFGVFG
jgi:uncharacterized membrane protein YfcA